MRSTNQWPLAVTGLVVSALASLVVAGCDAAPRAPEEKPASPAAERVASRPRHRIAVLGDSLTAGFRLPAEAAYPRLVEQLLLDRGWDVEVINAGVSGDTTAGGRSRLDWLLSQEPTVMVVALGANDGLRGQPIEPMEENLRAIVGRSLEAGAAVLLLGMKIPPNYGQDYADRFEQVYSQLAAAFDVPLMPFMLEDVGGVVELNLDDGIHPNAAGHRLMAANVMPYIENVLGALDEAPATLGAAQ